MSEFHFVDGESLNGAIARWGPENGIERMIDITRVGGVAHAHRQTAAQASRDELMAIADEMEVDADELINRATPLDGLDLGYHSRRLFNGVSVPSTLLETRRRRFAPAALAGDWSEYPPHHRSLWDFRLLPVCTETWQFLRHKCDDEGCSDLGWHHTPGIDLCEHCMAELALCPAETLDEALRDVIGNVASLVHHDAERRANALAKLPPAIAKMGSSVAIDLIVRLLPVVTPGMRSAPFPSAGADPVTLAKTVAASWDLVVDWPAAFVALISHRVAMRKSRHTDGNGGETMRFLNMGPAVGMSPEVATLATSLRASLDLGGISGASLRRATRTTAQAAKVFGISTTRVANLRRSGAIGTIIVLDGMCLQPVLPASELEHIKHGIRQRLAFNAVQWRLGISHDGVEQLEATGLIDALRHPYFDARYAIGQAVAGSVIRLEDRMRKSAQGDPKLCTLPLAQAMKVIGGRLKPWVPAFEGILSGAIPATSIGKRRLTADLCIDPAALDALEALTFAWPTNHTPHPSVGLVSKVDAMETLNLSPKQGTRLLGSYATSRGSMRASVPIGVVLDLARKHISVAELALRRRVSATTAFFKGKSDGLPWLGDAGFCRLAAEETYFGKVAALDLPDQNVRADAGEPSEGNSKEEKQ